MRGTEVALFDYASHNKTILGNNSVIFHPANSQHNDPQAIEKFSRRFEVIAYQDRSELDPLLEKKSIDLLYAIKSGKKDGLLSKKVPTMVHAVFPTSPSQVHGASFAFVSEWLSEQCSDNRIPCVPHIVWLPDDNTDLRASLSIPPTALVLGSYGGRDSFDIAYATRAVRNLLSQRSDFYFVAMNLAPFIQHPRAIFLPGSMDMDYKTQFINSCDAMLHARRQGESFGLACGEFSVRNKPVISYLHAKHKHHHLVLGDKGMYYADSDSLESMLLDLQPALIKAQDWDCYTQRYNPERVMDLFDRHLIHPAAGLAGAKPLSPGYAAQWAYLKLKLAMRLNRFRPQV